MPNDWGWVLLWECRLLGSGSNLVTSFGGNNEQCTWGTTFQKMWDLVSGRLVDISVWSALLDTRPVTHVIYESSGKLVTLCPRDIAALSSIHSFGNAALIRPRTSWGAKCQSDSYCSVMDWIELDFWYWDISNAPRYACWRVNRAPLKKQYRALNWMYWDFHSV
jgi:hypothetical protein